MLLATPSAFAFSNPDLYGTYPTLNPTELGGGAGRFFTGSPADGYGCSVCHMAQEKYSFPVRQKGLPIEGYVPGKSYLVELTWPEATASELQASAMGMKPNTELIAEFVSEEGGSGGTVSFVTLAELQPPERFLGLYCAVDPGVVVEPDEWADRYAMSLMAVQSGKAPVKSRLTDNPIEPNQLTCDVVGDDTEGDAQRCIIAVRPCGATTVKFIWKAPEQWRGPIWFAAGFVTTYDASGIPNDRDFVTELTIPMNAAYEGTTYENKLSSGCSIAAVPGSHAGGGWHGARGVWMTMLLGMFLVQRRHRIAAAARRSNARSMLFILTLLVASTAWLGCEDDPVLITRVSGGVGLYEPGICTNCDMKKCREPVWDIEDGVDSIQIVAHDSAGATTGEAAVGAAPAGSGAPETAVPEPIAGAGATAVAPQALKLAPDDGSAVVGLVKFDFTTTQPEGVVSNWVSKYCPDGSCQPHYWAAWIETFNEQYVRTLGTFETLYSSINMKYWEMGVDCEKVETYLSQPDVTTKATVKPQLHGPHEVIWDGTLGNGEPAPMGTYRLLLEVMIDEDPNHGMRIIDVPFDLTGEQTTIVVPPGPPVTNLTITTLPPGAATAPAATDAAAAPGADSAGAAGAAAVTSTMAMPMPMPMTTTTAAAGAAALVTAGAFAPAPNSP